MAMTKKQHGGFLPLLLGALAGPLIQGITGAVTGRGMKKRKTAGKKKGGRK